MASTVFISEERNRPHGSGIVVNYRGTKYLITATHVLEDKAFGESTSLKVFERDGRVIDIEEMTLLYSTPSARERNLPVVDIGVVLYDGKLEGVKVGFLQEGRSPSVAIGYPGLHVEVWNKDLDPLVSP